MPRAGYGELTAGAETSATQALHPPGSEAAPGSSFTTDPNTGMYLNAADTIGLTAEYERLDTGIEGQDNADNISLGLRITF